MSGPPALVDAFEAGNYRAVREGTARIAAGDKPDDVKRAARDLRSRTEPSRMQLVLLAITALPEGSLRAQAV